MVDQIARGLKLNGAQRQELLVVIATAARTLDTSGGGGGLVTDDAIRSQLKAIAKSATTLTELIEMEFKHKQVLDSTLDHVFAKLGGTAEAKSQTYDLMGWLSEAASVALVLNTVAEGDDVEIERDLGRTLTGIGSVAGIYGAMLPHLWEKLTGITTTFPLKPIPKQ